MSSLRLSRHAALRRSLVLAAVAALFSSAVATARADLTPGYQALVASYSNNAIKCYDPDTGGFIQDFASISRPTTMGVGPDGLLYVVSNRYGATPSTGKITRYKLDGTLVDTFLTGVSAYIDQIAFTPDGMLYVTNRSTGLLRYDPANGPYTGDNVFIDNANTVLGVAFDSSGNIFLSEYGEQDIEKYDSSGVWQSTLVDLSSTQTALGVLAIDANNNLYTTNYGANVIKVTPAGASTVIVNGLGQSTIATLGPDNKLYVGAGAHDPLEDFVNRYNLDGTGEELFIVTGEEPAVLDYPCGMAWVTITTPIPLHPGDANRDGTVDAEDAATLAANWLKSAGITWYEGDFNDDGVVDDEDATIMAANWGWVYEPPTAVPEPSTAVLALIGLALALTAVGVSRPVFGVSRVCRASTAACPDSAGI